MSNLPFRALVVDDEPAIRRLTVLSLNSKGFTCDTAGDGLEAESCIKQHSYDVVVTDLRMPNRHGHALAVELLGKPGRRPAIVVLTGVCEPRLAEDLLVRGVDAVEFKPVDYRLFSAKVRAIVERRKDEARSRLATGEGNQPDSASESTESVNDLHRRLTLEEFTARLLSAENVLPISAATLEVVQLTSDPEADADQIAAHLTLDPALTIEILKLANSVLHNPAGEPVLDLRSAIVRVGYKRIGELSLAATALNALTNRTISWTDLGLCWRRSLATSLAIEVLQPQSTLGGDLEGLFLASLMHRLGRVLLAWLYPAKYQFMVEQCRNLDAPLYQLEKTLFPQTTTQALARVLESWNVSRGIYRPLEQVALPFSEVESLTDPLRLKVELIKTASLLADLAVARWEDYDLIDFPSAATQRRVGSAKHLQDAIVETGDDLARLAATFGWSKHDSAPQNRATLPGLELAYCNLSYDPFDGPAALLTAAGIVPQAVPNDDVAPDSPVLLNCLGVTPDRLPVSFSDPAPTRRCLVLADHRRASEFKPFAPVLALPCSFNQFISACRSLAVNSTNQGKRLECVGS